MDFPGSSAGKESTCSAGNPSSIPGLGSSPGEGISYLLLYSWASLVAQMVKNLVAIWATWVQSLGWEDALEEGMATHSNILAWRIPWTEQPGGQQCTGSQRVDTTEWLNAAHSTYLIYTFIWVEQSDSVMYVYICVCVCVSVPYSFPLWFLCDVEYSSLCYTGGPCCLSLLYIIASANPKLPIHPSPQVYFLIFARRFLSMSSSVSHFRFHV